MRSSLISNRYLIVLLAALFLPAMQAAAENHVSKSSKAASLTSCVAATDVMRRNHMDFLKHERDETVREGIRGVPFSLSDCVDCHASTDENGKSVPVNEEGEFCATCHDYVAVDLPCFQCHRTTPEKKATRYSHIDGDSGAITQTTPADLQRD
jgi:predicted CXXCH cytochrome family protein